MHWLLNLFPHEDIGWKDIGETFIRYDLFKTRWGNIYLHHLVSPLAHAQCHNHPWSFVTVILKGGYLEYTEGNGWRWRAPGSVLYRPASWTHNVVTETIGGMWSLVITGPKKYKWGFKDC